MLQKQLNEREMYHLRTIEYDKQLCDLVSLGFSKEDYKFENFKSNFGYDWTKEDLEEALECAALNSHNVRNCLMEILG